MANQLPKACFRWKDASDPASPQGELSDRGSAYVPPVFSFLFLRMLKHFDIRLAGYLQEHIYHTVLRFLKPLTASKW
jgi:hypothetical protein